MIKPDKAAIVGKLDKETAQNIIERLDAAPGDNPQARKAIYDKYPELKPMKAEKQPSGAQKEYQAAEAEFKAGKEGVLPSFENSQVQRVVDKIDEYLSKNIKGSVEDYSGGLYGEANNQAVYVLKNGKHIIIKTDDSGPKFKQWIEEVPESLVKRTKKFTGPIKGGSS
jgi:hypothetical protein